MISLNKKDANYEHYKIINQSIDRFFEYLGMSVSLIGNCYAPMIVLYESNKLLPCVIKHNTIYFYNSSSDDDKQEPLCYFSLDNIDRISETLNVQQFHQWYDHCKMKKLYTIQLIDNDFSLCGFSNIDNSPLFGNHPKYYFSLDKAKRDLSFFGLADIAEIR